MTLTTGTLWTIGHSTREWEVFAGMLRGAGIEVLADVRRFAGSRRNPQFSPLAMGPALEGADIDYVPMPESVKGVIFKSWSEIKDGAGKPIAVK